MRTRKERAWQERKIAEERFTDAAIVIADNLAFEGKQPDEAELEEYRDATKSLERALREYAKTIQKEAGK